MVGWGDSEKRPAAGCLVQISDSKASKAHLLTGLQPHQSKDNKFVVVLIMSDDPVWPRRAWFSVQTNFGPNKYHGMACITLMPLTPQLPSSPYGKRPLCHSLHCTLDTSALTPRSKPSKRNLTAPFAAHSEFMASTQPSWRRLESPPCTTSKRCNCHNCAIDFELQHRTSSPSPSSARGRQYGA